MPRWLVLLLAAASHTACVDVSPRLFQGGDARADHGASPDRALDAAPPLDAAPLDHAVDDGIPLDMMADTDVADAGSEPDVLAADMPVAPDMTPDEGPPDPPPCGPTGVYFPEPELCLVVARHVDTLLSPRAGHTLTRVGGRDVFILVGGDRGVDDVDGPTAERLVAEGQRLAHQPLPGLRGERYGHAAVWIDAAITDHLIVVGGRTGRDGPPSRDAWILDSTDDGWVRFSDALRWGHDGGTAHAAYDEHALIIGGLGGIGPDAEAEMLLFEPPEDGWRVDHYHDDFDRSDRLTMPLTRGHAALAIGPEAVVWGGGYDAEGALVDRWARYDALDRQGGNREIDAVVDRGPAVAGAVAVALDDPASTFAVIGGVDAEGPRATINVCEVDSLRCDERQAPDLPPRTGLTATAIGDDGWIVLVGGSAEAPVELVRLDDAETTRLPGAALEGPLAVDRRDHRAARLADGRVMVTGGRVGGTPQREVFTLALLPVNTIIEDLP